MIMFSSIDVIVQEEMRLNRRFVRHELPQSAGELGESILRSASPCIGSTPINRDSHEGETMWTKRITVLFVVALFGLLAATAVSAGSKANSRKGKAYFKKNCRVCHDGNTAGAPALEPAELIIEQWERAFAEEDDVAECVPRVQEKTGVELTEQDLADIKAYLVDGAADSERPMTCG
jgi:mono/diheme cytochrome c family protein